MPAALLWFLLLTSCAGATPGRLVVQRAAGALGAAPIDAVKTIAIEGAGVFSAFDQTYLPDGRMSSWTTTEHRRSIDFARRRLRDQYVETPLYITSRPEPNPVITGYDDGIAYEIDRGATSRQRAAVERERRAELYHDPIGFLRAASAPGAVLGDARREGDHDAVDLTTAAGERFTLLVDRATQLPVRVVSMANDEVMRDVLVSTEFSDFADAGGWKLPRRITKRIAGVVVGDFRVASVRVNADVGELAAPAEARAAPAPASPKVTVEEVAPGVWFLAGGSHHSVVVELADRLVLIEAPADEERTLAVIAAARALRPGKPLTEVVNTHHHGDHAAGLRAAIAEGLTIITHESNRRFIEQIAARPSTLVPDALARRPRPPKIETAGDSRVLTDGARRIELYALSSAHAAAMLIVYLPAEKFIIQADLYGPSRHVPPPRSYPLARVLVENLARRGLAVERVLPLHGRMVPYAELAAAAAALPGGAP